MEEARLQKDGYERVLAGGDIPANLNEGVMLSSPILLWFRRRSKGGSGVRLKPIVDIVISEKLVDSALVIAGYTCLNKSTNKGTATGKNQYLWVRRAGTPDEEERDAVVDIAVTSGNAKNLDNSIHKPPGRGFIHVAGDLNRRALFAVNIYLWFRPITPRSAEKVREKKKKKKKSLPVLAVAVAVAAICLLLLLLLFACACCCCCCHLLVLADCCHLLMLADCCHLLVCLLIAPFCSLLACCYFWVFFHLFRWLCVFSFPC